MNLHSFYKILLKLYGPQGWWPVTTAEKGVDQGGYHRGDYAFPENPQQRFEIILGAILTQNTNWRNASEALKKLLSITGLDPGRICSLPKKELAQIIRSSGYYNQKAIRIQEVTEILQRGGFLEKHTSSPGRDFLLSCRGIGPETADSILLYAYSVKSFVIDLYTRRILTRRGIQPEKDDYSDWRNMAMESLPSDLILYQEFHALILAHGKDYCSARPKCGSCPIKKDCPGAVL